MGLSTGQCGGQGERGQDRAPGGAAERRSRTDHGGVLLERCGDGGRCQSAVPRPLVEDNTAYRRHVTPGTAAGTRNREEFTYLSPGRAKGPYCRRPLAVRCTPQMRSLNCWAGQECSAGYPSSRVYAWRPCTDRLRRRRPLRPGRSEVRATTPRSLRPRAGGTRRAVRPREPRAPKPVPPPPPRPARPRPVRPPCVYAGTETADTVSGLPLARAWWDVDVGGREDHDRRLTDRRSHL